ncbi:Cut8 six-helix bundle-domain-containing protein [Cokeromyces recurvatus]|uniref:Cut8 six-helix bundle-domain-containing protein n=1 Tax=Cokeromyces recurvatus TaxID=90255 RepID=UPI00221FD477|nr:Cut8 six-helix bundle-domain-containing protein [Cokeromyces recurvatus]KAI7897981.1 Cut8 six-helix bundle-domain-containing protein [Cokeromyces recurvatus]
MSSSPSQNSLFRQQQHLYRSAHFLAKSKPPTLYSPPSNDGTTKGRKRRASYEDEEMTNSENSTDYKTITLHSLREDNILHATKRNRMSTKGGFPISKLLATLDKDKLIELINDLVDSNPHLKNEVDAFIPPPTTQSISLVIGNLEKKLIDSFPYNKTSTRDDYTFNRVRTILLDIVNTLVEYAEHFISSPDEHPTTLFSYLHYATTVASRLPEWDNDVHNQIKRDLMNEIIEYWKKAVNVASSKINQGKIYGQQVVTEWAKELVQHNIETHGQFSDVLQQFTEKLGWIIGVDNPSLLSSRINLW